MLGGVQHRPVMAALCRCRESLRVSGTMDEIRGLEDIMRVAKNAGAKRIAVALCHASMDLQTVPPELISGVSPVFYTPGDYVDAAVKALGL